MPAKLSALRTRKLPPIEVDGGDLNIEYLRPTPQYADQCADALGTAEKSATKTVAALILPLIAAWDLLGDDGEPLPITEENLLMLPQDILMQIQSGIHEREIAPKNADKPSETGS